MVEKQSLGVESDGSVPNALVGNTVVEQDKLVARQGATLLGPVQIRELAAAIGVRPTKQLGQNFVHDAGTVRRIVRDAKITCADAVLEVGPGLGSLTLAILETGATLSAVEIDPVLAAKLPSTIARFLPQAVSNFAVVRQDALQINSASDLAVPASWQEKYPDTSFAPRHLVANLPYNVAVPIILTLLENLPSLETVTVMVQLEVAQRLAAQPGSKNYGVPSVKSAWYAKVWQGAKISRNVFWPVPNVDSALVHFARHSATEFAQLTAGVQRAEVFAVIDAAFSQRRKTLRAALSAWAGTSARAEQILQTAQVDPSLRGEKLEIADFIAIAKAAQ